MKLIIYRGSKEIGGSCFEVSSSNNRLLFDIGLPLVDENGASHDYNIIRKLNKEKLLQQGILPNIKGLYKDDKQDISAVFISHAHPDHYGLLNYINPEIPIYTSEITKNIMLEISPLLSGVEYKLPKLQVINKNQIVSIGEILVKAHLVDHSIPGSYAYEIDGEETKILYTGDISGHGRQHYLFKTLIKNIGKLDYLIMEGTTVGRQTLNPLTEEGVQEKLTELFKIKKLNIIVFSAQNLDRFISVFKSCLSTKKTLVIDPYTAFILEQFKGLSSSIPQFNWNNIRVYFAPNSITKKLEQTKDLYKYKSKKISIDEILLDPTNYVIKDNRIITTKLIEKIGLDDIQVIHSLWTGYLDKENNYWNKHKNKVIKVHSSGHAFIEDLKNLVEKLNPKNIIPIHTSCPKHYKETFGSKVLMFKDGVEYDL